MASLNNDRAVVTKTLLAASASALAIGLAGAWAQDDVEEIGEAPGTIVGDADAGEDQIVVTGSRIRRSELDNGSPVFTFGEQTIEDRAFTNVADLLNESPLFSGSLTGNGDVNGFTAGQNQANLFDLGTQRTLTLLNGRRLVTSNSAGNAGAANAGPGGQADLNTIPAGLIERVETTPLTGAAVYGADAVAGTVNIILKTDYEGFEVSGQYGVTDESDAKSYNIRTLAGANFADGRGNVVFSAEYTKDEGLLRTDRPNIFGAGDPNLANVGARALDLDGDGIADNLVLTDPDDEDSRLATDINGDGTPNPISLIYEDQVVQLFGAGGNVSPGATVIPSLGAGAIDDQFYVFNDRGDLETCEPGITPPGTSPFFAQGGTCGVDFFDEVTQLRSPVERFNAYGSFRYDLTDNITFEQNLLFSNTRGEEIAAQGGFQTFAFPGTSAALQLPTDNPFLTDQARGILEDADLETFGFNRFLNDIVGNGANRNETFVYRISSTLSGEFEAANRDFYWDVNAILGESDIVQSNSAGGIVDGRFINAIDARRVDDDLLSFIADQDPDDDDDDLDSLEDAFVALGDVLPNVQRGDIICGGFADIAADDTAPFNEPVSGFGLEDDQLPFLDGCVPLNLFGNGNASPEAINYVTGGPRLTDSQNTQTIFTANFGGTLFELPGGPLSFNVGAEARREEASFTPGLGLAVPLTRSAAAVPIEGRFTTGEAYGELLVPIVSPDMNIPFVRNLEFNGAGRYQRGTTTAPDGDQNTNYTQVYTASGRWQPIEDIEFRATYAEAFRNPSFYELFLPATQSFVSGDDPCDARFAGRGPNPEVRTANCQSIGINTSTFTSNIVNATIPAGINSGNEELRPEENESYSLGAVFTPRFLDGFGLAVDYYNLEIVEQIGFLTFEQLAQTCFDSNDFPNEPACATFERGDDDQVVAAQQTFANIAESTFEAITFRTFYGFDVADSFGVFGEPKNGDWGSLNFDVFVQHNIQNNERATAASEQQDDVGDFFDPEWNATADFAYERGPFRATWRTIWQDETLIDALEQQNYAEIVSQTTDENGDVFTVDIDNDYDARATHQLGLRYAFNDAITLQGNVFNVFDREPTRLENAAGALVPTDLLGRRYTVRLIGRF